MSETIFRGKHIHALSENKHLDSRWIEGYLSDENYIHSPGLEGEFLVDPQTVCQYTGCLTVDIKKIFVNDIVEIDGVIGVVKYGKYGNGFHLGYYIEWINCGYRQELGFWEGKVKHRGNVFDNPELIKR